MILNLCIRENSEGGLTISAAYDSHQSIMVERTISVEVILPVIEAGNYHLFFHPIRPVTNVFFASLNRLLCLSFMQSHQKLYYTLEHSILFTLNPKR